MKYNRTAPFERGFHRFLHDQHRQLPQRLQAAGKARVTGGDAPVEQETRFELTTLFRRQPVAVPSVNGARLPGARQGSIPRVNTYSETEPGVLFDKLPELQPFGFSINNLVLLKRQHG